MTGGSLWPDSPLIVGYLQRYTQGATHHFEIQQGSPTVSRTRQGCPRSPRQERNLQGPETRLFSLKHLSGTKKFRRQQVHHQLVNAKQVHLRTTVPYDKPSRVGLNATATGMVSFVRPARRILPRAHKEVTSQVPSVLLRRKLVLLSGATIRPECSSLHLHTTDAIPPQATTSSRSLSSCLPRRLGGVGKHTRRNQPSVRQYTELCHQARFSHKSREVQPYPLYRHRVARCQMAYDSRKVGHSSVQTRKLSRSSKGASHSKPLFAQRMGSPLRDAGLLGTDPNPPSTSTATSPPASVSGSSARQGREKTHSITTQNSVTSVDGPKHPQWDRDLPTLRQCHPPVDRCLQFGLGGSHQQPVGLGLVELGRGRPSHQSAGSSSSEVLHSAARTEGLPYSPLHRQFIGAVRDKKTFCKISIAMSGSCFTHSDSRRSILDHRDIQDLHPLEQQGGRPEQTTISDDGLDPPSEHR